MPRQVLDEARIHPAIREKIADLNADIVRQVQEEAAANAILIVGMRQNPMPKHAKRLLERHHTAYKYLEYGSYLSGWRRRTALKMWTGWPTFPMIFVKGTFIGGAEDLARLQHSGELKKLMGSE